MKVTIDIDCSPEEARAFLGLPDVSELHASMLDEVEARLRANLNAMDPDSMMKTWFPVGAQSMEQLQKTFWAQMAGSSGTSGKDET